MKHLTLLILTLLLVCLPACATPGESQKPQGPTVSIRVEGISENLAFDAAVPLTGESSALSLVSGLLDTLDIPYHTDSGYLTAVGNDAAGAFGGWDGFVFYLNGQESLSAPDTVLPQAGDVLLFCYADLSGQPPTLLPRIEATRGADGLVTLTVLGGRLTFRGETAEMVYAPVAGAEVTVNEVLYYTDGDGKLLLDEALSSQPQLSIQTEHYTEDGKPLLIRLEPDFILTLPQ